MRYSARRIVDLLVVLALCTGTAGAVTGCGNDRAGDAGRTKAVRDRARKVAEAWDGSEAARVWNTGYHPVGDLVQLPDGAFRSDADKRAYTARNFVLTGKLPASGQGDGRVRWESGEDLTLPLLGARKAYEELARGRNDGPHLTVTGAELGEMRLATSRGPATVPAWLFTVRGYDTPLRRVALGSSKVPEPPVRPAGDVPTDDLTPLEGLVETAGDGRSVTVAATHGSCDDGPAVDILETKGTVVLSAYVVGTKDGPCTSDLRVEEMTVRLDSPLGRRILLDAFTGRPVTPVERKTLSHAGS